MPYDWHKIDQMAPVKTEAICDSATASQQPPLLELHLRPNISLPKTGFATFVGVTCILMALPIVAMIGRTALWFLLSFFAITLCGLWFALRRSEKNAHKLLEVLKFWPDRWELIRHNTNGKAQNWQANPHWIEIELHEDKGPVEHYLTLRGNGRKVELGAFLSPDERKALAVDLQRLIAGLKTYDDVERLLGNQV